MLDIQVKDWEQNSDQGNVRELQYRVAVNQPMGPPTARVEETQRYHLTKFFLKKKKFPFVKI